MYVFIIFLCGLFSYAVLRYKIQPNLHKADLKFLRGFVETDNVWILKIWIISVTF
jgi:hypothetical protein